MLQLSVAARRGRRLAPALAVLLVGVASAWSSAAAPAATAGTIPSTTAGDFWVEPPTLQSLGFEWRIKGDDDRASVASLTHARGGSG